MIKHCGCKVNNTGSTVGADWQDAQYGKGNREHNEFKNKAGTIMNGCTVCGKVTGASGSSKEDKKEKNAKK